MTQTRSPSSWLPAGVLPRILTGVALLLFLALVPVSYYVIVPSDYGSAFSMAAYAALLFPASFLIVAGMATALGLISWFIGARLAAVVALVSAVMMASLAIWPVIGMELLARENGVALSIAPHFGASMHPKEFPLHVTRDVAYGTAPDGTKLLLDIWPAKAQAEGALLPAFVRVHGGAWVHGAKSELPAWNTWLNDLGFTIFDVEYRMPPPTRWKDEVGDVKCALGWVLANAATYGIDTTRISLTGYSAGANLAMLAAYGMGSSDIPASCPSVDVPIKSVVNLYGPAELHAFYETTPSPDYVHDAFRQYVGGPPATFAGRYRVISPLTYVDARSPPTISMLGGSDRIVPREQAALLDRALAAAGVKHETYILPGADHGFDANWNSLATQFARAKIRAFIEKSS